MRSVFPDRPGWTKDGPLRAGWWIAVWLPVVLALAVICVESTEALSAANTSGWLRPVFEGVLGPFKDNNWDLFHHYLRKMGHFLGYGTMGLTFLRAWLYTLGLRLQPTLFGWRMRATMLAILCTAAVASGDEFHQTFLPGRTGLLSDVLLDTCGAAALCLLVWLVRFRRPPGSPEPLPVEL